jgi:copper(I)-binding protein
MTRAAAARTRALFSGVAALGLFAIPACSGPAPLKLSISKVYAEAAGASAATQVYATIHNDGRTTSLIGASSPVTKTTSFLGPMTMPGGEHMVMQAGELGVPMGRTLTMVPGGNRIVLGLLQRPLHPGDTLPVTLRFDGGKPVTVTAKVADADQIATLLGAKAS